MFEPRGWGGDDLRSASLSPRTVLHQLSSIKPSSASIFCSDNSTEQNPHCVEVKLAQLSRAVSSAGHRGAAQVTHQPSVRQQIQLLEWKITSSHQPVTCHLLRMSRQTFHRAGLVLTCARPQAVCSFTL